MVMLKLPEKWHMYTHAVKGLAYWFPWLKRNIQYFPVLFLVISFEHASMVTFFFKLFFSSCVLWEVVEQSGSGQHLWKLWPFTHTKVGLLLGWKSIDTVKLCNHNCFPGNTSVQPPSKSLLELARTGGLSCSNCWKHYGAYLISGWCAATSLCSETTSHEVLFLQELWAGSLAFTVTGLTPCGH